MSFFCACLFGTVRCAVPNRPSGIKTISACLALIWMMVFGGTIAVAQTNIIVFQVDDLGWSDVSLSGRSNFYETSNLEQLAQRGVNFTHSYAASPVCSPTRSALMTGKAPARNNITDWIPGSTYNNQSHLRNPNWNKNLSSSQVTMAEALKIAGYRTGHVGKWHLGRSGNSAANPLNHGFDVNIGGNHQGSPTRYFANSSGSFGIPNLGNGTAAQGTYLTDTLTDKAVDFINSTPGGTPFFLSLQHYGVHNPIQAPANLVQKYQNKLNNAPAGTFPHHNNPTYAAMIESVDASLGQIMQALQDAGVADNTLIVFTSDNGGFVRGVGNGPTSSHPLAGGKGTINEGGIRVPTVMAGAGPNSNLIAQGMKGQSSDQMLITHDLYPTLLNIAGAPGNAAHNANIDGVDIAGVLQGQTTSHQTLFWHYPHISDQDGVFNMPHGAFVSAVRKNNWKLIYFYEDEHYELYNLTNDIAEQIDLINQRHDVAHELSTLLHDFLVHTNAQTPLDSTNGNQPVDLPSIAPLPEPSSAMLLMGAGGLLALKRSARS